MAFIFILKEIEVKGDELAKHRPEHDAVAELTRREAHANGLYKDLTKWSHLSSFDRAVLIGMVVACEFSVFVMVMMGSTCFKPFSVDKDINAPHEDGGLNGDPLSIVEMPGWCAL